MKEIAKEAGDLVKVLTIENKVKAGVSAIPLSLYLKGTVPHKGRSKLISGHFHAVVYCASNFICDPLKVKVYLTLRH